MDERQSSSFPNGNLSMARCHLSLLVELSRPIQRVGTCRTGVVGVRSSYAPLEILPVMAYICDLSESSM